MNGYSNLCIAICGLVISLFCNIHFFSRKNIGNKETAIFSRVLIYSLIDSILMVLIFSFAIWNKDSVFLLKFLNKFDYAMYILWISNFFLYVYYVSTSNKDGSKYYNFFFYLTTVIDLLFIIIMLFLKVDIHYDEISALYSDGNALNLILIGCSIYMIAIFSCLIINSKNVVTKKLTPLFVLIFLFILVFLLNYIDKSIVIVSSVLAFTNLILYFTIENPDMKMLSQVELARDSAERANRAKTEFLSSMSHEIRTPLNAIVGFSECISKAESLESAKEDAKDIITASQNLLEIVNGILDISKIESGKMELVESNYDLVKIGDDLTKLMIPRIGEKPIKLNTSFAPDIPGILYGDGSKVKQIISNILTNAVKYTEKGEINFKINCINDNFNSKIIISIEDTGRGIKPEKIDTLFNRFERLEEDRNTTVEGTGLGLAITKTLVEMMGGKITVQSKYGIGSVFTVCIVQRIVSLHREEKVESLEFYDDFSSKTVLVVDDNKLNIKIASRLLSEYKVNISDSESGNDVINRISNGEKFDLILMDDMMPNMSGTETMKKLKEIGIKTPIVVLTANAIEGMKENYLSEGFDYYLSKPIDKKELEKVLNNYLGNNSNNKESHLGPLPESVYKITEEDIREIDELMPRSELEKINEQVNDQEIKLVENAPKIEDTIINEEVKSDNVVEVQVDNNLVDSELLNQINDNLVEMKDEVVEEKVVTNDNVVNKGNKEFLINNGIDVDKGLELLGDMEMYEETLKGFLTETSHRIPEMLDFKNSNNMKDYAIHAHAMKSDSKYLGFTKLAELSLDHELKGKENDSNYINEHYDELMFEVDRITSIVKEYLGD